MLPTDIVSFNKTFDRRLREFELLFNDETPCTEVFRIWTDLLSLTIGDTQFKALWKLSKERSLEFKVLYPLVVKVEVNHLIPEELSASVEVLESQEDVEFPRALYVPIFELYPLKEQNMSSGVLIHLADVIDRCRFFFLKLWYPWDCKAPMTLLEWKRRHLYNRLKLQYAILSGEVDRVSSEHIHLLLSESISVADALEGDEETDCLTKEQKLNKVKNIMRMEQLRVELELYESPQLRNAVIEWHRDRLGIMIENNDVLAVGLEGRPAEISTLLELMCSCVQSTQKIKPVANLEEAIRTVQGAGTILLAPGIYQMKITGDAPYLGNMAHNGGTIKGVDSAKRTILQPDYFAQIPYYFLASKSDICFENLTIQRTEGLLLSGINNELKRCVLRGNENEPSAIGIVVKPGGLLRLENCEFYDLSIAIVLQEGARARIVSCQIRNCNRGIQMAEDCTTDLKDIEISNCSEAGIFVTHCEVKETTTGSLKIVDKHNKVTFPKDSVHMFKNKVNVYIDSKHT